MRVVLLHDARALTGRPDERDGIVQVESIAEALRALGHEPVRLPLDLDLAAAAERLQALAPDCVFNLVEAVQGEGRLIHLAPALLDSLGIPYTGARTAAMLLGTHKVWSKRLLEHAGLPTPAWLEADGRTGGELSFPARFIVKSIWEDASVGLDDDSLVESSSLAELSGEIERRRSALGGEAFAEVWIEGREFNISVLEEAAGPRLLPLAEMCFADYPAGKPRLVGYRAKWEEDSFEYTHTVRRFDLEESDGPLVHRLEELTRRSWELTELRGYGRVDFRVDETGQPWILEVNPNPCLSPDAGFLAAAERAGLDRVEVIERILVTATSPPC